MVKVERMQIGATIDGIRAERQLPRNTKLTSATSARDRAMVIQTSWIASRVNTVQSTATARVVPAGRDLLIRSTCFLTALEISRSLACDWRVSPMPIRSLPFCMNMRRRSSGPSSTWAMSPRRVM